MAENKKNNNILYIALVIAGILLLLIPFFLFDVGSSLHGTGHLTRFGLHILAFAGALLAGSLVSTGVANASASATTMKVIAISSAAVIGTAVTINTVQYVSNPTPPTLAALADPVTSITAEETVNDTTADDNTTRIGDTAPLVINTEDTTGQESLPKEDNSTPSNIAPGNKKSEQNSNTIVSDKKTNTSKITKTENTPVDKNNTTNTIVLNESCQSFQVLHGSKQLDRRLGLSIYDPNKTIKFNNDCGCVLKEATMSLSRKNEVLEQKIQNGNFINLHTFKDLQAEDKLTVEIRKASCKDNQGTQALYTFPKPILTIIQISDHREFETASEIKANKKNPSNTPVDNSIKAIPKDKVEDEVNKYGN